MHKFSRNCQPELRKTTHDPRIYDQRDIIRLLGDSPNGATSMLIQDIADGGRARATGGTSICTYKLAIFFLVLERGVSQHVSREGYLPQPDGKYREAIRLPAATPYVELPPQKNPDSLGRTIGVLEGGKRGICIYTPAGLQSHCNVHNGFRQGLLVK